MKMKIFFKTVFFICSLTAFFPLAAQSEGEKIVILAHNDNPPYVKKIRPGEASGIAVDILRYVQASTPYTFVFRLYPWKRAYRLAEDAEGAIIGISKTSKRMKIFDYSEVIYFHDISIVVLKGKEFSFNRIEDLRGKTVAVHRGSTYTDEYEKAMKSGIFKPVETNSSEQRLQMLIYHRVDAALIGDGLAGINLALQESPLSDVKPEDFSVLPVPLLRDPNYLAISKKLKAGAFIKTLNQALEKGKTEGIFEQIQIKYIQRIKQPPG